MPTEVTEGVWRTCRTSDSSTWSQRWSLQICTSLVRVHQRRGSIALLSERARQGALWVLGVAFIWALGSRFLVCSRELWSMACWYASAAVACCHTLGHLWQKSRGHKYTIEVSGGAGPTEVFEKSLFCIFFLLLWWLLEIFGFVCFILRQRLAGFFETETLELAL